MKKKHKIASVFASLVLLMGITAVSAATITITVDDSTGDVGGYTSLTLNEKDFPVISYQDYTNRDLKLAVCGSIDCSSGNILITVDSAGNTGYYTSLALNSNGFPVISYYDLTNSDLKIAVCGDSVCSTKTIVTVDSIGNVGEYSSLKLSESDHPIISYHDNPNGNLKIAVCGDPLCNTKTITVLDSAGYVGQYTSLALSSSGLPIVSYYDYTNRDLKIAICGNATCTSANTITTLDSIGNVGQNTSLALKSDGRPIISYRNMSALSLKVAMCGDTICSSGNILTNLPGTTGVVGANSIVLTESGRPVISYYDLTYSDLKIAVCGDASCSSGNTLVVVDSSGIVGDPNSLALNSNGYPVIGYVDGTNANLKAAMVDIDTVIPKVVLTNLSSTYIITGPSSFVVTFSENVNNAGGGTLSDDAANPNNYVLMEQGSVSGFQTTACNNINATQDTRVTPSGVTYIPNTAIVNFGVPLPAGTYRLFVCGTTSIVDLAGNHLNNGVDYTFDFAVSASATTTSATTPTLEVRSLPTTGFAPNVITRLPEQPAELAYTQMSNLWLEIPSQNVKANIVGVPQSENIWDVKWLGNDAGWLNGTAFPSWEGNSVLTAHVMGADGLPGPFAKLQDLKYGERIIVHMLDQQYTFEVRNKRLVRPESTAFAFEHLEDASYLTLVTCSGYNEESNTYSFRRIIRAVLVEVK